MAGGGVIKVASANLEFGGVGESGDLARLRLTVKALGGRDPDVVLLQEVTARTPEAMTGPLWGKLRAEQVRVATDRATEADAATIEHLAGIADALDMTAVLGPPSALMFRRMHTAVLVRKGLQVVSSGPPMPVPGSPSPAWCEVVVLVDGMPGPLAVYSVHLPARSAAMQLIEAEWLASIVAQHGRPAILGGDFNGIPRAGDVSAGALLAMRPHLRTARMTRDGGELRPDYAVDDVLGAAGLIDAAASLTAERRTPCGLTATGRGGARVDRFHVSEALRDALAGYEQWATGGADHDAMLLTFYRAALAEAVAASRPADRPGGYASMTAARKSGLVLPGEGTGG